MHTDLPVPDRESFQRVWRRVMPQPRPDCPITLDPPPALPPLPPDGACLSPSAAPALPTLDRLYALTAGSRQAYLAMARRAPRSPLPLALARQKELQLRRLSAARFLISGEGCPPPKAAPGAVKSLPHAIREQYHAEQSAALALLSAVDTVSDPCLIDLYRSLALEDRTHAGALREWLERS